MQVLHFVYDMVSFYFAGQEMECKTPEGFGVQFFPEMDSPAALPPEWRESIKNAVVLFLDERIDIEKSTDKLKEKVFTVRRCYTENFQKQNRKASRETERVMKDPPVPRFLGCKYLKSRSGSLTDAVDLEKSGDLCEAYKDFVKSEIGDWIDDAGRVLNRKKPVYIRGKQYLVYEGICHSPELQLDSDSSRDAKLPKAKPVVKLSDDEKRAARFLLLCDLGYLGRHRFPKDPEDKRKRMKGGELEVPGEVNYLLKLRSFAGEELAEQAFRKWEEGVTKTAEYQAGDADTVSRHNRVKRAAELAEKSRQEWIEPCSSFLRTAFDENRQTSQYFDCAPASLKGIYNNWVEPIGNRLWHEAGASQAVYVQNDGAGLPAPDIHFGYARQTMLDYKNNDGHLVMELTESSSFKSRMEAMAQFTTAIVGFTGTLPLPGKLKEEEDAYKLFMGAMKTMPTIDDRNGCGAGGNPGPDCNRVELFLVPSFAVSRLRTYSPLVLSVKTVEGYYQALGYALADPRTQWGQPYSLELNALAAAAVALYGKDASTQNTLFREQHCILIVSPTGAVSSRVADALRYWEPGLVGSKKKQLFQFTGNPLVDARTFVEGKKFDAGDIITGPPITGRGVDWKCSANLGLLVIAVSHSDSEREQRQVMGRAARAGEHGAYLEAYLDKDLVEVAGTRQAKQKAIAEELQDTVKKDLGSLITEFLTETWPKNFGKGEARQLAATLHAAKKSFQKDVEAILREGMAGIKVGADWKRAAEQSKEKLSDLARNFAHTVLLVSQEDVAADPKVVENVKALLTQTFGDKSGDAVTVGMADNRYPLYAFVKQILDQDLDRNANEMVTRRVQALKEKELKGR
ncbi:unnamed protein product [Amoebophrya sp. A25]|nr:unnamed protein product [Amoebophrya sp. A25]|eukprot:GSA25T00008467001.1